MPQNPARFELLVQRGPEPEQVFELNRDLVTIGRDVANHIVFSDPEVSRRHLRLQLSATGYDVLDLGSTNGTYLNQQRIHDQQPLRDGDLLGIGDTVLLLYRARAPIYDVPGGDTDSALEETPAPADTPMPASARDFAPHAPQRAAIDAPQAMPRPTPIASGDAPPRGGYGYEELTAEESGSPWRLIFFVAILFLIFFCCIVTIAAIWIIDESCSWDQIPLLYELLESFGFSQQC